MDRASPAAQRASAEQRSPAENDRILFQSKMYSLQRKVWDGSIPIAFYLDFTECTVYKSADPYIVQVPRISYLPTLLPKLLNFFQDKLIYPDAEDHKGWFSIDGSALPWHYPVGILYDIYTSTLPPSIQAFLAASKKTPQPQTQIEPLDTQSIEPQKLDNQFTQPLPWKVTVHFHSYPTDILLPLDKDYKSTTLLDSFQSSVKEASFIRHRTTKVARTFSLWSEIWESVTTRETKAYNHANALLLDPQGTVQRCVPLRLFVPRVTVETKSSDADGVKIPNRPMVALFPFQMVQAPMSSKVLPAAESDLALWNHDKPYPASFPERSLGSALHQMVPDLFPSEEEPGDVVPLLHGAVIPMSAPLETLGRYCAFPDGWVCITLSPRF